MTSAAGHAASEGLAWVPLLAGLAAAGSIGLWAHRPIHVRYAAGAGAAGLWAAAAWWAGLTDPVVLGSLALLTMVAAWIWIRHQSPRARVRVRGGSILPWQWERWQFRRISHREIRRAMASWETASYWGKVPRSKIRSAVADLDEDHRLLTVELVSGHIAVDLDVRRAASGIGAPVSHVRIVDSGRDSDQPANIVQVRWFYDGADLDDDENEEVEAQQDEATIPPPVPSAPEEPHAVRRERLKRAAEGLGAQVAPARELARRAKLPHDWVNRWLPKLAPELGLRRVKGGWQRLAVEEDRAS
jgi:hypothetical protein